MATEIGTAILNIVVPPGSVEKAVATDVAAAGPGVQKEAAGLGKVIATGVGVGVVAVGAIGAGLFKLGSDFKQATNIIRTGSGQTGLALYSLQQSFQNVYTKTPAGMNDVANSITTIYQKLGLTGPQLDQVTLSTIQLSRLTKSDLGATVQSITGLFNNWGVSAGQMPGVLDMIYRTAQHTGIGVVDLSDQVTSQAAYFRELGIPLTDSIGLIGLLSKVGLSASSVTAGFRKEIVTATKAGKPAAQAFKDVFDSIKKAPNQLAAAQIGLENFGSRGIQVVDLIRSGKLDYGTLVQQISDTSGDTIAKGASDVSSFGTKLDVLKHKLAVDLKPEADAVFSGMGHAVDAIGAWFDQHHGQIESAFSTISGYASDAAGFVGDMLRDLTKIGDLGKTGPPGAGGKKVGGPVGAISGATNSVLDAITGHDGLSGPGGAGKGVEDFQKGLDRLSTSWPGFVSRFRDGWHRIGEAVHAEQLGKDWDGFVKKFSDHELSDSFGRGIGKIGGWFTQLGGRFALVGSQINEDIIQPLYRVDAGALQVEQDFEKVPKQILGSVIGALGDVARTFWNVWNLDIPKAVGTGLEAVRQGLDAFFPKLGDLVTGWAKIVVDHLAPIEEWFIDLPLLIGDGLIAGFTGLFNTIGSLWNKSLGSISFDIPSWVPGIGGKTFSAPKIPKLHDGGTVPGSRGSDVPAILQAGEFVIPRDVMDSISRGSGGVGLGAGGGTGSGVHIESMYVTAPDPRTAGRETVRQLRSASWRASGR